MCVWVIFQLLLFFLHRKQKRPLLAPSTKASSKTKELPVKIGTLGTFHLILTFPRCLCPGNHQSEGRADGHCSQYSQYTVCAAVLMGTTVVD